MVNAHMTAIRIEVPIESDLITEIDPATSGVDLTICGGNGQLPYWAATTI